MDTGLLRAITEAGGVSELARRLGLTHQAVVQWRRVPAHRIIEIERATGIPREKLRPDLYRREEAAG